LTYLKKRNYKTKFTLRIEIKTLKLTEK
jgi:hypothetical protein